MIYIQALGIWLIMLVCAVINGGIRDKLYAAHVGEYSAHVISTLILTSLVFVIASIFIKIKNITDTSILFQIGILWVLLTMSFEFLFFHYVAGAPWQKLIADYNIFKGRLFILLILADLLSPFLASKIFLNK